VIRRPGIVWFFVLCSVAFSFGVRLLEASPREQSVSTSRQFIVFGTRVEVRGAICDLAERTKRDLLGLLGERDRWITPIVVNAQYSQANLPEDERLAVDVGQTGSGLKLQLNLLVDAEVSAPAVRREILRALLIEMMYRGKSDLAAGAVYSPPPDWLLDGIPSSQPELSRDRTASVLALPVAAGTVLSLEKFLQQRPQLLDNAGRLLYRAYAVALVELLAGTDQGPRRLAGFIADLSTASNDPIANLRQRFPILFDSASQAENFWQRQIARVSARQPYDLLGGAETGRILKEKLRIRVTEKGGAKEYGLGEFKSFVSEAAAQKALAFLAQDLRALELRANPVFAPVIAEYAQVTTSLARGKTSGAAKRLARLDGIREALTAQMGGIDDFLNWYEATSLSSPSGAFNGYLRAADSAAHTLDNRRDPISVYLDAIETQFQN
jgi:hypothetical protein